MNWQAVTSLITALTAIAALVFTGLSLNATRDQVAIAQAQNRVAEQGQFTDRYAKAVEQIGQQGPDRLQVRLGAIYSLERLARDSPRDQPTIIAVLSAFIHTSASPSPISRSSSSIFRVSAPPSPNPNKCPDQLPNPDIQAALTVLGRRDSAHDNGARIDLWGICLRYVNLTDAHLKDVNFNFSDLSDSSLSGADLTGAAFARAQLVRVNFTSTNLTGALLPEADLSDTDLNGARLADAYLRGAYLTGADLTGVNHNGSTVIEDARTDALTLGMWW